MTQETLINTLFLQNLSNTTLQFQSKLNQLIEQSKKITPIPNFEPMIQSTTKMISKISNNLSYLTDTKSIFFDDFQNAINLINIAFNSYLKSLNSIESSKLEKNLNYLIQTEIDNFSKSFSIFSSSFLETIDKISNSKNSNIKQLSFNNMRLGIESILFTFSFEIHPIDEWPYFQSNFIQIYQFYNQITSINKKIAALQAYYKTGKTTCVPLILMIQSLKNQLNAPFCFLIQPTEKEVEMKTKFFNSLLSKYITIVSDPKKILEMSAYSSKIQTEQKLIFGVFTPFNMLYIIQNLGYNQKILSYSRIIIDDANSRTIYSDCLIAKIITLNKNPNIFHLPLNITLLSSLFSIEFTKQFSSDIQFIDLIKNPPFEVQESTSVNNRYSQKNNNEVVIDETALTIEEMSQINSKISEGHILCFLSNISYSKKLKDSISLIFRNKNESQTQRKIIILQTTLKSNESIDNYFKRLTNELDLSESLNEGKKHQYETIYFVPIILSPDEDDKNIELALNEFPNKLHKINKIICSMPIYQSSLNINNLSIVIDNGLEQEEGFDISTGLQTINQTTMSWESMNERKGKLGKNMKGLYIPVFSSNSYHLTNKIPEIEKHDLTTDILRLKNIRIDLESIENFPFFQNDSVLKYSIKNLLSIRAINSHNYHITQFGRQLLNFSFIPIYYSAAVIKFKDQFSNDAKQQMYFISLYISTIISMDSDLIKNDLTDKLSKYFREDSDLVTLINALNSLIVSKITDPNEFKILVESFGFSYQTFIQFKQNMQTISDATFPGKKVEEVIYSIGGFLKKYNGIASIIDRFIAEIEVYYPGWKRIHSIEFKCMSGAGSYEKTPTVVFIGDNKLKFKNQPRNRPRGGVRILTRPGWNGVVVPDECYCFNIYRMVDSVINVGRLIHRKSQYTKKAIFSIESDKNVLNPWFDILISTYFENDHRFFIHFYNNSSEDDHQTESQSVEKKIFHYSKVEERVFISFIPRNDQIQSVVTKAIAECLKLMPFTPRSVLIYRKDIDSLVEVMSVGAQHYESTNANTAMGDKLNRQYIDYCLRNVNELVKSNSNIRICSLFINDKCNLSDYDQKNLYIISQSSTNRLLNTVRYQHRDMSYRTHRDIFLSRAFSSHNELGLFQFPTKFIHPALLHNQDSFDIIMKWFINHCDYAKIIKVIGSRLLMRTTEIFQLQNHLRQEKQKIIDEMKLNYVAIPIPKKINDKHLLAIQNNKNWSIVDQYKCIVTTKDEEPKVREFLESAIAEFDNENQNDTEETLCCLYICDDPDNPELTNYPITVYYQDGTRYTNRMCRDCLVSSLQIATESFYSNEQIDQESLEKINFKPSIIPSIESKETRDGLQCWPQIPLGQMISALINDDFELSSLISAWLNAINEYTIRTQSRLSYTYCPDHPHKIFHIIPNDFNNFKCNVGNCDNCFCEHCNSWHSNNYVCDEMKNGEKYKWKKFCPKCKVPVFKDGGCNHITCPCGCHWCYKCGEGFDTSTKCYDHLTLVHGGCFDYNFD